MLVVQRLVVYATTVLWMYAGSTETGGLCQDWSVVVHHSTKSVSGLVCSRTATALNLCQDGCVVVH